MSSAPSANWLILFALIAAWPSYARRGACTLNELVKRPVAPGTVEYANRFQLATSGEYNRVIQDAAAKLMADGTRFKIEINPANGLHEIVILPNADGTTLNRFAEVAKRKYGVARTFFSPAELQLCGGHYQPASKSLLIGFPEILELRPTAIAAHEIIHAKIFALLAKRVDSPFHADMQSRDGKELHPELAGGSYKTFLSLSEINTFGNTVGVTGSGTPSNEKEFQTFRRYLDSHQRVTKAAAALSRDLADHIQDAGTIVQIIPNPVNPDVATIQILRGNVRFRIPFLGFTEDRILNSLEKGNPVENFRAKQQLRENVRHRLLEIATLAEKNNAELSAQLPRINAIANAVEDGGLPTPESWEPIRQAIVGVMNRNNQATIRTGPRVLAGPMGLR